MLLTVLKKEDFKGRGSGILERVLSDPAGVLTISPGQVKKNGKVAILCLPDENYASPLKSMHFMLKDTKKTCSVLEIHEK